jgi:4-phytase/acid phosphatase
MKHSVAALSLVACLLTIPACALNAQATQAAVVQPTTAQNGELKYEVIISRHGVRSPTAKTDQLNPFSRQPWPEWSVAPGYLTAHGFQLMQLVGAYDRQLLTAQGLIAANNCDDAAHIRILADSDQRTRETGKALADGIAPGCKLVVAALPEGTPDPLFHSLDAGIGAPNKALAIAEVAGRIGNNPAAVAEAYRAQLDALEAVLRSCAPGAECNKENSLFDLPVLLAPGRGDHLVELRTPLGVASSLTENLLLEYAEGFANVGWGHVDLAKLRELLQLHTAQEELGNRSPYIARAQSSNLLYHAMQSMAQAASGKPVAGALDKLDDRLLILVGHDTNLANIGGALQLSWLIDGRLNDTPPGGALVFELWKKGGAYEVRTWYTAQTLDQMRNAAPLTLSSPPERVPVFIPACGRADGACSWQGFQTALKAVIDPAFVRE